MAAPLLVSVRSGARASMPGMMDTILNLGLNDETVKGLAAKSGNARFAYDSYRRFIQMYADVVLGVDHGVFEDILDNHKNLNGFSLDTDLGADHWQEVIADYQAAVERETGKPFPQDTAEQLWGAIGAVFGSWHNDRAKTYRRLHGIPDSWGTAVNVQAMVFGNLGQSSATGVAFTRNPSTGAREIYGEFLVNAQGEDVVAGIRTPQPLDRGGAQGGRREAALARSADAGDVRASSRRCSPISSAATATCRTSSSPSRTASSGCCRRAPASARPRRHSRSRSISWPRG